MATPVTVPRLGWSMEEGVFVEWLKAEGENVRAGEALFVLEGEKAAQECEAPGEGVLRLFSSGPQRGDRVAVGAVLAYLLAPGEEMPQAPPEPRARPRSAPGLTSAASRAVESPGSLPPASGPRRGASPRAARLASELGIDWRALEGTGRGGRVRERDVRRAAEALRGGPDPGGRARAATARRMAESLARTSPVTLTMRADMTSLAALRRRCEADWGAPGPSWLDLVLKLAAVLLPRHPELVPPGAAGARPEDVGIGIAVDTSRGLLVPVLRGAACRALREVAEAARGLIEEARSGRLQAGSMEGGCFTITNLGMFGVDAFTPIIRWPERAILGLGAVRSEPAVVGGRVEPRELMALSLTFDHRALDGAAAARFLQALRQAIEGPAEWIEERGRRP